MDPNIDIAIMTYNQSLNFYQLPADLNNELTVISVNSLDKPFAPISRKHMFMNVMDESEKIEYLIEKLFKFSDEFDFNNK